MLVDLVTVSHVWSREQVLKRTAVPRTSGIYGWWFRQVPLGVPTAGCVQRDDLTLLHVGIAPGAPPTNGKARAGDTPQSPPAALQRERLGLDAAADAGVPTR
jgi:hypothetical protein